jgi:hypothetical protein
MFTNAQAAFNCEAAAYFTTSYNTCSASAIAAPHCVSAPHPAAACYSSTASAIAALYSMAATYGLITPLND